MRLGLQCQVRLTVMRFCGARDLRCRKRQSDKVTDVPVAILVPYRSIPFATVQSPGRICARALLAVASSSMNRR